MTAEEYAFLRIRLGTQKEVAERLGVHPMTVSKRERGKIEVSREMEIALRCLAEHGTA